MSVTITGTGARDVPRSAKAQPKAEPPVSPLPETAAAGDAASSGTDFVIKQTATRLSIELDKATNRYIFKTVDPETGEVIRQYPTELMLSQIARVRRITGLTVDQDA
ncbi:MAG: flagellar protein FlaG [Pseudomonadota bacterium]